MQRPALTELELGEPKNRYPRAAANASARDQLEPIISLAKFDIKQSIVQTLIRQKLTERCNDYYSPSPRCGRSIGIDEIAR